MSLVVQPRAARRLIVAAAAAIALLGLLLVLLVATLMGGLAPPSACGPGAAARYAPSRSALADIPGNYLQWIRQAGDRYGLDWSAIAGIYSIESDFGRLDAPGVRSGENVAGARGPGQSLGRITLHECRHTYASFLMAAGYTLKEIMEYMGHANLAMVQRYVKLLPQPEEKDPRRTAQRLPRPPRGRLT